MSVLASDDFTRADAANLGANWTNKRNSPGIVSNQVDITTTADTNVAYHNASTPPADAWCQGKAIVVPSSGITVGVGVRLGTAANPEGYWGGGDGFNTGDANRRLWKVVVSTWTSIASEGVNVAANDILYCEAQGTTVKLFVNGVEELSVTDASLNSGRGGVYLAHGTANVALLDDWSVGDFLGTPVPTQRSRLKDAPARLGVHSSGWPSMVNNIKAWF